MVCSRKKLVLAKEVGKVRLSKYLFLYLAVLGLSCIHRFFRCGMQDLVLWQGIEPGPPALGVCSPSQWTTREVPKGKIFLLNGQHAHDTSRSVWVSRIWCSVSMCWLHKWMNAWVNEWNRRLFEKKWTVDLAWQNGCNFCSWRIYKKERNRMANSFHDDGDKRRLKRGWRKWDKGALKRGRGGKVKKNTCSGIRCIWKNEKKYFMLACRYIIEVYKWWVGELNYNPVFNLWKQRNPPKHGEHWKHWKYYGAGLVGKTL